MKETVITVITVMGMSAPVLSPTSVRRDSRDSEHRIVTPQSTDPGDTPDPGKEGT